MYRSRWIDCTVGADAVRDLWTRLSFSERTSLAFPLSIFYRMRACLPVCIRRVLGIIARFLFGRRRTVAIPLHRGFPTIRDVFHQVDPAVGLPSPVQQARVRVPV